MIGNASCANAGDNYGNTPLHEAAEYGHTEMIELLHKLGAEVNAGDNDGDTPLHEAARYGDTETAKRLGELGADPEARNNKGQTPLDVARSEEVKALLRNPGAFSVSEQCGVCSAEGGRRSEKNEDETKTIGK